jgi:hypothetical protein
MQTIRFGEYLQFLALKLSNELNIPRAYRAGFPSKIGVYFCGAETGGPELFCPYISTRQVPGYSHHLLQTRLD